MSEFSPVSEALESYVLSVAEAIELPIPDEYRQGVVDHYARILPLAKGVMEFPLPPQIEVAFIFRA